MGGTTDAEAFIRAINSWISRVVYRVLAVSPASASRLLGERWCAAGLEVPLATVSIAIFLLSVLLTGQNIHDLTQVN